MTLIIHMEIELLLLVINLNLEEMLITHGADKSDIFTFICTGNGNLKEVYRSLDVVFTNL
jgi:hypothetical protein